MSIIASLRRDIVVWTASGVQWLVLEAEKAPSYWVGNQGFKGRCGGLLEE